MRLYLVRHGAAQGQQGRIVGHADPPLSPEGSVMVEQLVASMDEPPARVVGSDLARARASAGLFADRWGIEPKSDPRLREMDFGEWENRTWQELEQHDGARLDAWMRDWVRVPAPGGESFTDLMARVRGWLDDRSEATDELDSTVVVAHAGSIRAILCVLLAVPMEEAFGFEVDYARVTGVSVLNGTAELICSNAERWPAALTSGSTGS